MHSLIRFCIFSCFIHLFLFSYSQVQVEIIEHVELSEKEYTSGNLLLEDNQISIERKKYEFIKRYKGGNCNVYIQKIYPDVLVEKIVNLPRTSNIDDIDCNHQDGQFLVSVDSKQLFFVAYGEKSISTTKIFDVSEQVFQENIQLALLDTVILNQKTIKNGSITFTCSYQSSDSDFNTHYCRIKFRIDDNIQKSTRKRKQKTQSNNPQQPKKSKTLKKCKHLVNCPICSEKLHILPAIHPCKKCHKSVHGYCYRCCWSTNSTLTDIDPKQLREARARAISQLELARDQKVPACDNNKCPEKGTNLHMRSIHAKNNKYIYICYACSSKRQSETEYTKRVAVPKTKSVNVFKASEIKNCKKCAIQPKCIHCDQELVVVKGKKCKSCKKYIERYCTSCYTSISKTDSGKFSPEVLRNRKLKYLATIEKIRGIKVPVCINDLCTGHNTNFHMMPDGKASGHRKPNKYKYKCYACSVTNASGKEYTKFIKVARLTKPKDLTPKQNKCRKCRIITECPHCKSSLIEIKATKCKICKCQPMLYCKKCYIEISKMKSDIPVSRTKKQAQQEIDKLGNERNIPVPGCTNSSCEVYGENIYMRSYGIKENRYRYRCRACSKFVMSKEKIKKASKSK